MKEQIKFSVLNILFLSVILITSFPYSKFVYYPVVFISFLYALYYIRFNSRILFYSFKSLLLIIIQLFLFVIAFLVTNTINQDLIKEGIKVLTVVLIGFVLLCSVDDSQEFKDHYIDFIRIAIYSSLIISFIGIIKFILELRGIELPIYYKNEYPLGSSLLPDYNFFSTISLIGIVFIIYNILEGKIKLSILFQQFALFCLSSSILLTASRRANIILFVIIGFLILLLLYNHLLKSNIFPPNIRSKLFKSLIYYLALFILINSTITLSLIFIKPESKVLASKSLGFKLAKCQYYSTLIVYKLESVVVSNEYTRIFSKLWHGSFDSRFPQSGWGNGDYSVVHNLDSLGLQNLPSDATGIKLDNSTNSYFSLKNTYYNSFMMQHYLKNYNRYIFDIYCYISPDYNGNLVSLITELSDSPEKYASYDLNKKGTWQKLSQNIFGDNNSANFYISFYKDSVTNFSFLKGYIIFAYPKLDSIRINPDDPYSWASINFKEVFPLKGDNVEIVPDDSRGCLLDSSAYSFTGSTSSGKYTYSYMPFGDSFVSKKDTALSAVYCYVDTSFNGNIVMLMTGSAIKNSVYDLSHKGKWQKLSLNAAGNDTKLPIYMYFAKYGVPDFSTLHGFVIFAHPTFKIIYSDSLAKNHLSLLGANYSNYVTSELFTSSGLNNKLTKNGSKPEDIGKLSVSDDFNQKYLKDNFAGPRLDHWRFATHIFKNYSTREKIFGGGFDYMNQFGKEFDGDITRLDWPHNPSISVILYAGIVGLIAYLWLLFKTVYLYWLYSKEYWPLFGCFIICFFFSFFSANNPLDPPIMGFFIVLPFIIHSIHKREVSTF